MKQLFVILFVCFYISFSDTSVVIISGSKEFQNYRHQADACHAYKALKSRNIENIILLSYDDVPYSKENPLPGTLYNTPNGQDVYKGCEIDYKGNNVNPEILKAVLTGNSTAVKGIGTGRVLKPAQNIFIVYTGLGGPGFILFPDFQMIFKDELLSIIQTMKENQVFKKLAFYMDSNECGEMLEGFPQGAYGLSATNSSTYSYATYCGLAIEGQNIPTCIGDLFTVNWIERLESTIDETLNQQFQSVQIATELSPVTQYGDLSIGDSSITLFQGTTKSTLTYHYEEQRSYLQHDAKLQLFYYQYKLNPFQHSEDFISEIQFRENVDKQFKGMAFTVHSDHDSAVESLEMSLKVYNLECYKKAVNYYWQKCGVSEYSLKYMKFFNTICMTSNMPDRILLKAIDKVCP